MVPISLGRPV